MRPLPCLVLAALVLTSVGPRLTAADLLPDPVPAAVAMPIAAPGDAFVPPIGAAAAADAPAIAEFTRSGAPDDLLVVSGSRFSAWPADDARHGSDTRFLVWAGGRLREADIVRLSGDLATIALPADLPAWSAYLLVPVNVAGRGRPVVVNRTEAWWVGPNVATRGDEVAIYGRNLARGDGTAESWIRIQRPDGSGGRWVTPTAVTPYRVAFTVPADLGDGSWRISIHNGHGGAWGWSRPLELTIDGWPAWTATEVLLTDHGAVADDGGDDSAALAAALAALKAKPAGATLRIPAGTFRLSKSIIPPTGHRIRGAGSGSTTLVVDGAASDLNPGFINGGGARNFAIEGLTIDMRVDRKTAWLRGSQRQRWRDVVFTKGTATAAMGASFDCSGTVLADFADCSFIDNGDNFSGDATDLTFRRCRWIGMWDANQMMSTWGGRRVAFLDCTAGDLDGSDPASGRGWAQGRFWVGHGHWGGIDNLYFGGCRTTDMTVRPSFWNQNTGEQILWEGGFTDIVRRPLAAGPDWVEIDERVGDLGGQVNQHIAISEGPGRGQTRRIAAWDRATRRLTVDEPWLLPPTPESMVQIGRYASRLVVHGCSFDAKDRAATQAAHTASVGVEPYGASADWIIAGNVFSQMRQGISQWSLPHSPVVPTERSSDRIPTGVSAFSLITGNTFDRCRDAVVMVVNPERDEDRKIDLPFTRTQGVYGVVMRRNAMTGIVNTPLRFQANDQQNHGVMRSLVVDDLIVAGAGIGIVADQPSLRDIVLRRVSLSGGGTAAFTWTKPAAPALREVASTGYAALHAGAAQPGGVLEMPRRVLALDAANGFAGQLAVWNAGTASLAWTAAADVPWLRLSATAGMVADASAIGTLAVQADASGLAQGQHAAVITMTGGGRRQQVRVLVQVGGHGLVRPAPLLTGSPGPAPAISGTGSPGNAVAVRIDGADVAQLAIGGGGAWSLPLAGLATGSHTVIARFLAPDGRTGPWSEPLVAVRSGTPTPAAPQVVGVEALSPLATGTAAPGAVVIVASDGVILGQAVAGPDGRWRFALSGLAPGAHAIRVRAEGSDAWSEAATAAIPSPPGGGSGLTGTYFGAAFAGQVLQRIDADVAFDWGAGTPDPAVPKPFSIRWTGAIEGRFDEEYTFTAFVGGRFGLWIDGVAVIDPTTWTPIYQRTVQGTARLRAGVRLPIRIEYEEDGTGSRLVQLSWASLSQQPLFIPTSQLHPAEPAGTPPATPSAPAVALDGTSAPVLSGAAPAGASVAILIDGRRAGTAAAAGTWSWTVPDAGSGRVEEGLHQARVYLVGSGGTSGISPATAFAVWRTPAKPARVSRVEELGPDLLLGGPGVTGGEVAVYRHPLSPANLLGRARCDAPGDWRFVARGLPAAAALSFVHTVMTPGGTSPASDPSPSGAIAITANAPMKPAAPTGAIIDDGSSAVAVAGTWLPGERIMVVVDGIQTALVGVADTGAWRWSAAGLAAGAHVIRLMGIIGSRDRGGLAASDDSAELALTVGTALPTSQVPVAPSLRVLVDNVARPLVGGEAAPGALIEVVVDGQPAATQPVAADGTWSVRLANLSPGMHAIAARARNRVGASGDSAAVAVAVAALPRQIDIAEPATAVWHALTSAATMSGDRRAIAGDHTRDVGLGSDIAAPTAIE